MSLTQQLARLRAFLDSDELYEESLDYIAAHGYMTALAICPERVPEDEWIAELFAEQPEYESSEQQQDIESALLQLYASIERQLASDEDFVLPCELSLGEEPDESELRGWCIGFMEGVFLREDIWFEEDEDEVSELLLPIMVLSGLFDEQPDFAEIAKDPDLLGDMMDQLPELLTTLFLLCQSPDEEKPVLLKKPH